MRRSRLGDDGVRRFDLAALKVWAREQGQPSGRPTIGLFPNYLSKALREFIAQGARRRELVMKRLCRPKCPHCRNEVKLVYVFPIIPNHELRWFECVSCRYCLNVVAGDDDAMDVVEDRISGLQAELDQAPIDQNAKTAEESLTCKKVVEITNEVKENGPGGTGAVTR